MANKCKFKVGDNVVCVEGKVNHETGNPGGMGWERGFVFKIDSISNMGPSGSPVYWGGANNGSGVYEDWLELEYSPQATKVFKKIREEVESEIKTLE